MWLVSLLILVCSQFSSDVQAQHYPCDLSDVCQGETVCRMVFKPCLSRYCPPKLLCVPPPPSGSSSCPSGLPVLSSDNKTEIVCGPRGSVCPDETYCKSDPVDGYAACCWKVHKPGSCPVPLKRGSCAVKCNHDNNCSGDQKCCSTGCGFACTNPGPENKPGFCPVTDQPSRCGVLCKNDQTCTGNKKCCQTRCGTECVAPVSFAERSKQWQLKTLKSRRTTFSSVRGLAGVTAFPEVRGQTGGVTNLSPFRTGIYNLPPVRTGINNLPPVRNGIDNLLPVRIGINNLPPVRTGINNLPPVRAGINNLPPVRAGINNLPPVRTGINNLPPVRAGINNLPPIRAGINNLPPVRAGINNLPPVRTDINNLPPVRTGINNLPPIRAGINNLPQVRAGINNLPPVRTDINNLPPVRAGINNLPPVRTDINNLPPDRTGVPNSSPDGTGVSNLSRFITGVTNLSPDRVSLSKFSPVGSQSPLRDKIVVSNVNPIREEIGTINFSPISSQTGIRGRNKKPVQRYPGDTFPKQMLSTIQQVAESTDLTQSHNQRFPVSETSLRKTSIETVKNTKTKPGICPRIWSVGSCEDACHSDAHCPGKLKCCNIGRCKVCMVQYCNFGLQLLNMCHTLHKITTFP